MALDIAAELCLSAMAASLVLTEDAAQKLMQEMSVSPFSEAALALHHLLADQPAHFMTEQALKALGSKCWREGIASMGKVDKLTSSVLCLSDIVAWEACYMASNQAGAVTIDAREALCDGLCHVLATLPRSQQGKPFLVIFIPTLECLRIMTEKADSCSVSSQRNNNRRLDSVLVRVADEIRILSVMAQTYQQVTPRSPGAELAQGEAAFLPVLRQAWSSISHVAEAFNTNEVCLNLCYASIPSLCII